jgi:methionyl-tRNA formyltransferase
MALQTLFESKRGTIDSEAFFNNQLVPVRRVTKPYYRVNIDFIKKVSPDILVLFSGFGIIKEALLKVAPLGVLSQHHGDMRKYRGMPPAFLELYNGESEMGVSVQKLSEKLDLGVPILEKSVPIYPRDTWKRLKERAYKVSGKLPYLALRLIHDQKAPNKEIATVGKIYTLPNMRQWLRLQMLIIRNFIRTPN